MTEALILLSMFLMIAIGLPIAVAILASALVGNVDPERASGVSERGAVDL